MHILSESPVRLTEWLPCPTTAGGGIQRERIRATPFRELLLPNPGSDEHRRHAVVPFVAPRLIVDAILLIALSF